MGWFDSNHPGHEGYIVGLVLDKERGRAESEHMRQLAYPHDDTDRKDVTHLQGACSSPGVATSSSPTCGRPTSSAARGGLREPPRRWPGRLPRPARPALAR